MKAITPGNSSKLKRLSFGASSLVVATMTVGTAVPAAASQHTDDKGKNKNQGSIQNNKNQRNTRNYNYTYNINYYFNEHETKSRKPPQHDTRNKNNSKTAKNSNKPKSSHDQKDEKFASTHSHNKKQNRVYTETKWVYDPRLCRWVEIGFNKSTHRWELTYASDRKDSRQNNQNDNRNYSYWYND